MKNRIKLKYQKLTVGYILCIFLALYSTAGFWNHIDGLKSGYGWMMKAGVLAGEFACFVLVTWHILRQWWGTRVYCLIASLILGTVILFHNAGVIQIDAARVENQSMLTNLAEGQKKIVQGTTEGINQSVSNLQQSGGTKKQINRAVAKGQEQSRLAGTEAGQVLAETTLKAQEKSEENSMLPIWYRHGPMYAIIFLAALLLIGGAFGVMEWGAPYEDDDEDGIPNYAEAGHRYYDRDMAAKYWHNRGYLAPHESIKKRQPDQAEKPEAPTNGLTEWQDDDPKSPRVQ